MLQQHNLIQLINDGPKLKELSVFLTEDYSTESNAFSKSRNINSPGMLQAAVWLIKTSINLIILSFKETGLITIY